MVTKTKTVLGKHRWRKDQKGQPLLKAFTTKAWKLLPPEQHEGKSYPKAGFVEIEPSSLETPPEAKEATKKSAPVKKASTKTSPSK